MQLGFAHLDESLIALLAIVAVGALMVGLMVARWSGRRRRAARFAEAARALGATATRRDEFMMQFDAEVSGRRFEVRDQYIGNQGVGSQRSVGSAGWYLATSTPLARRAWQMHHVEFRAGGGFGHPYGMPRKLSGDADFDADFTVNETGSPVRERWLDAAVRAAVRAFFTPALPMASLAVDEGKLVHHASLTPNEIDATTIRALLERQAALAAALEKAAQRDAL
jgi:hypothetical protein